MASPFYLWTRAPGGLCGQGRIIPAPKTCHYSDLFTVTEIKILAVTSLHTIHFGRPYTSIRYYWCKATKPGQTTENCRPIIRKLRPMGPAIRTSCSVNLVQFPWPLAFALYTYISEHILLAWLCLRVSYFSQLSIHKSCLVPVTSSLLLHRPS